MKPTAEIVERLRRGETISAGDPDPHKLRDVAFATRKLLLRLNQSSGPEEMRALLSEITGMEMDQSTAVFPPLY